MTLPSLVVSDTSPVSALVVMGWLEVTGTVGIVLWAKAEGLVPSVWEALNELRRQAGFFLKQELIEAAARQAGEEITDENVAAPTDPT